MINFIKQFFISALIIGSCLSCLLFQRLEQGDLSRKTINVAIDGDIAVKSTTVDGGMRKLQAITGRGGECTKHSEYQLVLTDYESESIPVYNADVYYITQKKSIDTLCVKHLTTTNKNGEFCVKRKYLRGNGIIISLIGFYQLNVNLN